MIVPSALEMRNAAAGAQEPSASKIPARYPLRQAELGRFGHRTSSLMASNVARDPVRIMRTSRRSPTASANTVSLVAIRRSSRNRCARRSASKSASASRKPWTFVDRPARSYS
jgi:hypothetical protein